MPFFYSYPVSLSGCAQIGLSANEIKRELDRLINLAMHRLFEMGYRRLRTIKLERTGDPIRYRVMGWPQ